VSGAYIVLEPLKACDSPRLSKLAVDELKVEADLNALSLEINREEIEKIDRPIRGLQNSEIH
jgi:hypothetical protein